MEGEGSYRVDKSLMLVPVLNQIQGDSGGICTTLGNDSMSDSKQKSS